MFLLVICEIVGLFVNTLAADEKYSLCYWGYLQQQIQMQLSRKQKNFCESFAGLLKYASSFEHFGKKDDLHSSCISEVTYCEGRGSINVENGPFQKTHGESTC